LKYRQSFSEMSIHIDSASLRYPCRTYAPRVLEYVQKMPSWRVHYANRTLTGYSTSSESRIGRRFGHDR
jgi:hypothetical protein